MVIYGCKNTYNGASTSVMVLRSLISTCSDGPAVSLNGSPTVSPTTPALCGSLFLPSTVPVVARRSIISPSSLTRRYPASIYFLALSHAPPPLRSEEHTSELQSLTNLVCRLLL